MRWCLIFNTQTPIHAPFGTIIFPNSHCAQVTMKQAALCCLLAFICTAAAQFLPPPQLPCGGVVSNVAFSVNFGSQTFPFTTPFTVISFTTQSALAHYDTVTLNYPSGFFVPSFPGSSVINQVGILQASPGKSILDRSLAANNFVFFFVFSCALFSEVFLHAPVFNPYHILNNFQNDSLRAALLLSLIQPMTGLSSPSAPPAPLPARTPSPSQD